GGRGGAVRGTRERPVPARGGRAGPRRPAGDRVGNDAFEVGGPGGGARQVVLDRQPVRVELHRAARAAVREQVAGHLEGPFHEAGDFTRNRIFFGFRHREAGRAALYRFVGEVRVSELREGVVAHRQLATGVVHVAGDGEVPGEVEAVAVDSGLFQGPEDAFEVFAPGVDLWLVRGDFVAVVAERGG